MLRRPGRRTMAEMNPIDIYVNKSVPLKFKGQEMSFELSHALFSSFDIDAGSRLLLKLVAKNVEDGLVGSILDVGSGVGVLGVACARGYPGASLRLRDRDALACAFSERNARRNKVRGATVDRALFLDIEQRTMTALGPPAELRDHPPSAEVHRFLTRSSDDRP